MLSSTADVAAVAARAYPGGSLGDRLQRLRPYICPFERLLPHVPAHARVLDVGCGSGLLVALLASDGRIRGATGIDPSATAIARARRMREALGASGASMEFVVGDEHDLGDAQFDAVTVVDVIHHVPPNAQRAFLHRVAARVRPGGVLLYKDLDPARPLHALANRLHDLTVSRQWVHYVPLDRARAWAAEAGLVLERDEAMARLWYAHHLLLFRRPEGA